MALPGAQQDRTAVAHERRVVGVDRVGPRLATESLDDRARSLEHRHERIVLRLREPEVDRLLVERAFGLVRGAEALAGPVDEHAAQPPRHPLCPIAGIRHGALCSRGPLASAACPT